jgi:hypothetical protein
MILPCNSFRLATAKGFDADLPRGCFEHAEIAVNSLSILLDWSINEFFSRNSKHAVQNGTLGFNHSFLHSSQDQKHILRHFWRHIQGRETIPGRELQEQILIQNSPCQGHSTKDMCPPMNHTRLALFTVSESDLLNKLSHRGAILWNKSSSTATSEQHPPRPGPWETLVTRCWTTPGTTDLLLLLLVP